ALRIALPDTGTGAHLVLRQVVAEVLGLAVDDVEIVMATTDDFATDSGVGGSRVTHTGGRAAYHAAEKLKAQIQAEAAKLGVSTDSLAEIARASAREGRTLEASHFYDAKAYGAVTSFTAQVAEVAVDAQTGQVTVRRFTTAHDVGTVINPIGHQGQIEGGLIQGLGFALMEEIKPEEGRISTLSLGDVKLPTIQDIPPLTTVILEDPVGPGPFNAKAIGEGSISAVAPAIANAVADACGARILDLPITAEKVYFALRAKAKGPPRTSGPTPCSKPSWTPAGFSAASARPARSCRPRRCSTRSRTRATRRLESGCSGISAGAPATTRSSSRSGRPPSGAGRER